MYTVTVDHNGEVETFEFTTERGAVAQIEFADRNQDLKVLDYSSNINPADYRY
jgi:hypothetical protein